LRAASRRAPRCWACAAGRPEEGTSRWFRRSADTTFDQADIQGEAAAFRAFVEGAVAGYGLDPERLAFLGYSNGANLLAAVIQLHPGLVRRAVLLRSVQVLQAPPAAGPLGNDGAVAQRARRSVDPQRGRLAESLRAMGARVEAHELQVDHQLAAADRHRGGAMDWANPLGGRHA
jgi:phospholipase/carboxylesterase